MPRKMAKLAPRPPFGLPEVPVAVYTSRRSCTKAGKARIFMPIGSHPGNPGRSQATTVIGAEGTQ
jgi:hypothetical protein